MMTMVVGPVTVSYTSIGIIHTPFKEPRGTPIQATSQAAGNSEGWLEIFPEYRACLKDLDGFSHVNLLYHFHLAGTWKPLVKPFLDTQERGLFSVRAPSRPNPIGLSVVSISRVDVDRGIVHVRGLDIVDGTPLLDIKPHVPQFDHPGSNGCRIGWLDEKVGDFSRKKADDRFSSGNR